jgi:hypothetical protein
MQNVASASETLDDPTLFSHNTHRTPDVDRKAEKTYCAI